MPIRHLAFLSPGNFPDTDPFDGLEHTLQLFAYGEALGVSLFNAFLKPRKSLFGMGCKARCAADSRCYRQAPQRRRPPEKALARRVGVKSGDCTPRLLAWA
jgi:hypothetical protein